MLSDAKSRTELTAMGCCSPYGITFRSNEDSSHATVSFPYPFNKDETRDFFSSLQGKLKSGPSDREYSINVQLRGKNVSLQPLLRALFWEGQFEWRKRIVRVEIKPDPEADVIPSVSDAEAALAILNSVARSDFSYFIAPDLLRSRTIVNKSVPKR